MAISKLTADEIANNIAGEFSSLVPEVPIDVFMQSPYGILAKANSVQTASLYDYTEQKTQHALSLEQYSGAELEQILLYRNIKRLQAQYANGAFFAQDDIGTVIPVNSIFAYNDILYQSTAEREVISNTLSIQSIIRNGTQATITTTTKHYLGNNAEITISNTGEVNFDITTAITVTNENTFTITVANTGATSVFTGNIAYNGCLIDVIAQTIGSAGNIPALSPIESYNVSLSITSSLVNGLGGGSDTETDVELRQRGYDLLKSGNLQTFTKTGLELFLKSVYGITHSKIINGYTYSTPITSIMKDPFEYDTFRKITFPVPHPWQSAVGTTFFEITGASNAVLNRRAGYIAKVYDEYSVLVNVYDTVQEDDTSLNMQIKPYYTGQSTILIYKADDVNKTFSTAELSEIKNYISNEHNAWTTSDNDYTVQNFVKNNFQFNFTSLEPNLTSLKNNVKNNLVAWSKTITTDVSTIFESEYESIIRNTTDTNGNRIKNFTLSASGDILLGINELFIIEPSDVIFA